ncbi:ABC transporter ATP-binding protein [Paenibacillus hamazuiensis]|uniref:ABC transporter ATP-binding protein n=1 Tax=Paenibacillus hamazuiensis TaxID=2936508 RepID=UPI00200D93C7|nr:ABC transporter ATP-binding protein [Paenibacillus hamazuiensis]
MILEFNGVTKVYSGPKKTETVANDNLSLSIKEGEIMGLLGHNGAGKTTLMNQAVGLTTPTSGEILLMGKSVAKDPVRARTLCSVQPQSQLPLGSLTPTQAVSIMGKMRGGRPEDVSRRMKQLFEALDIGSWANKEGMHLSGGVRRLTAFCMAVVTPGKVVILDEPTNDVDPVRRRYLWGEIRKLTDNGSSVILVTHNVLEAEKAVDRVAILHKGKFLALGTPSEVKRSFSSHLRLEASLATNDPIETPGWALSAHRTGERVTYALEQGAVTVAIDWAGERVNQGSFIDYSLSPTTLEDVYVQLTEEKEGQPQ